MPPDLDYEQDEDYGDGLEANCHSCGGDGYSECDDFGSSEGCWTHENCDGYGFCPNCRGSGLAKDCWYW